MSDVNLRRFVDINIIYHESTSVVSTRDTVVYLETDNLNKTYSSYAEVYADASASAAFKAWAKVFFDNNGIKIHHVGVVSIDANAVKALDDKEVVICVSDYDEAIDLAEQLQQDESYYGIKRKVIVTTCLDSTDTYSNPDLAVKYSDDVSDSATIAAYLCQIDFYDNDVIKDYCYTEEDVIQQANNDTILGQVLAGNMNVDMKLAGHVVNIGGNMKDGHDLTNNYALIVLQQLLTERLIRLLLTKIKGSIGLSEIQSTVADEMKKFLTNGYLTTDKIWKDDDLNIVYDGKSYNIIKRDEPLLLGYKFVTLPIQALTAEDKALRKAPPMYLIVADSYGIRSVTINGEVI